MLHDGGVGDMTAERMTVKVARSAPMVLFVWLAAARHAMHRNRARVTKGK